MRSFSIGINLEPVEENSSADNSKSNRKVIAEGRKATLENARKAASMGVDSILLTGNPGVGVTNEAIKKTLGDQLILAAGKMHEAGVLSEAVEKILTKEDIREFREASADIILLPAPGTVPGITMEYVREMISFDFCFGRLEQM